MDRETVVVIACGLAACLPFLALTAALALARRERILTGLLAPFAAASAVAAAGLAIAG